MPEKPTCRNGNAYGGVIVLQGWHPTQCNCIKWKYGTIWGSSKNNVIQTWPRLQMRKLSRQPNASKNKLNSLSNGLKRSYTIQRSWWLMRENKTLWLCLFKKSLLEKVLSGVKHVRLDNDSTWQGSAWQGQPYSHHQRSFIISQISGAILAWNMNSLGIWVRFC